VASCPVFGVRLIEKYRKSTRKIKKGTVASCPVFGVRLIEKYRRADEGPNPERVETK
jgi:hypothetical protein